MIVPQALFARTGRNLPEGRSSIPSLGEDAHGGQLSQGVIGSRPQAFTVEAWIVPDSGGVVCSKAGQFELKVGEVGSPGPAIFTIELEGTETGEFRKVRLRTADEDATPQTRWVGTVYPRSGLSLHASYDQFSTNNDATTLNQNHRELIHVVAALRHTQVSLFVNGTLMAEEDLDAEYVLRENNSDLFVGGKGGEFRGTIESLHLSNTFDVQTISASSSVANTQTVGLWRFEEPLDIHETLYTFSDITVTDATSKTLTVGTTLAQALVDHITGSSGVTTVNLETSPYTAGDYKVVDYVTTPGTPTTHLIKHTPLNILINPGAYDRESYKPNNRPPERCRLLAVDGSAGTVTVESIHLDWVTATAGIDGTRGILHSRSAANSDNYFVLLTGDLLIDGGTGKPYQPPHYGSQSIDRTGQVVVDESDVGNHGLLYSSRMETYDTGGSAPVSNPFAVEWPTTLDNGFKFGHGGRHTLTHVTGHHYLRMLPKANEEVVEQSLDGTADAVDIYYDASKRGVKDQLPINSRVDVFREVAAANVMAVNNSAYAFQLVENGMDDVSGGGASRGIIAIGGSGTKTGVLATAFDPKPFLLRSPMVTDSATDLRNHHLRPITEPRVAILSVPTLGTTHNLAPFVEVHYNAVDLTGVSVNAGNDTSDTMGDACLLVTKTVPDAAYDLGGGTRVVDVIKADLADAAKDTQIYSPGGLIRIESESQGSLERLLADHALAGDSTGGTEAEDALDESLTPPNYAPTALTDPAQKPPQSVQAGGTEGTTHESSFHRILIDPANPQLINQLTQTDHTFRRNTATTNTGTGIYDVGVTSQATHLFELFDVIDSVKVNSVSALSIIEILVHPSNKARTTQLTKLKTGVESEGEPNAVSIHYLMGRTRVESFSEQENDYRNLMIHCRGLSVDAASTNVDALGSGSPDSHLVKEIAPGSPVVTVTLGGPGQGAVNTKPTWDPSPIARLGWSTRRDCAVRINITNPGGNTIDVAPLNNQSTDLSSWGTYCFPVSGTIYLENGAFASYASKTGVQFVGLSNFTNSDGTLAADQGAWEAQNSIVSGTLLLVDPDFTDASICADGTSINDRMFQTGRSVNHDYQLGTQYASTRALVEIPLFSYLFFDDTLRGILPGPDNSLKMHLDATYTAHTWNPNPYGRRCSPIPPIDPQGWGAYSAVRNDGAFRDGTHITRPIDVPGDHHIYIEEPEMFVASNTTPAVIGDIGSAHRFNRAFLQNGEWVLYDTVDVANKRLVVPSAWATFAFSDEFRGDLEVGMLIFPGPSLINERLTPLADSPILDSAGFEGREDYYYDRANVMSQGGNVDYGMRQYVSAVEFRAGPLTNPHLERIKSKRGRGIVHEFDAITPTVTLRDASEFPIDAVTSFGAADHRFVVGYYEATGTLETATYAAKSGNKLTLANLSGGFAPAVGEELIVLRFEYFSGSFTRELDTVALNTKWLNPYCPGGLREGDTVWSNMHFTNPHAIEGLFCKSRGTYNENKVATIFNDGMGEVATRPRDSIPLENFLIGDDCLTTARNFVQHMNRTIALNWTNLGRNDTAPKVAFLDPYQSTEEHARVLLYDVAHDREFIAFQDLWMQVQTSAEASRIGVQATATTGSGFEGSPSSSNFSTALDVANGFASEDRSLVNTAQSEFMESCYSHNSYWNALITFDNMHNHGPAVAGCADDATIPRTSESACCATEANTRHKELTSTTEEKATFFDTPDGTRCIPAFLSLKGIRNTTLDLTGHTESARLQHLDHWTKMDFVRRLSVDLGEVGVKEGVTDIEAAAREVVRLINQAGAPNGRTHARRPADQYPGESERMGLRGQSTPADSTDETQDPSAAHLHADFSVTGSTFDPTPFWDEEKAFSAHDRGSHMGYLRAHMGRVIEDLDGNEGFTVVIHSTVPGASGRNFCAWLDNSKGQAPYKPQFLIGHGGRFRSFWCQPDEMSGENMHPAPMPINKDGRPFAPITTLREYLPSDESAEPFTNNLRQGPLQSTTLGAAGQASANYIGNTEFASGRSSNTLYDESFESQSPAAVLVDGLRVGTAAQARINFGGLVASGVPGWAPDAGKWGFGEEASPRFEHIFGENLAIGATNHPVAGDYTYTEHTATTGHIPAGEVDADDFGSKNLYGFRFADHRGNTHTVRLVYRQFEHAFANERTTLPPTLEDEIIIWLDDRDCGQGGFTIGRHMWGSGDVCGRLTDGIAEEFVGNLWNPHPNPAVGIKIVANSYTGPAPATFTFELDTPLHAGGGCTSGDILGYLGFPDTGVAQVSDDSGTGTEGAPFHYTGRSHFDKSGDPANPNKHYFYGVTGNDTLLNLAPPGLIISPRIGWTTLVTDELIAAIMEFVINTADPNSDRLEDTAFDCTQMRAADGRTFAEWGVSATAIRVKAFSQRKEITPLNQLFHAVRTPDWGIQAAMFTEESYTAANAADGKRFSVGHLPETVLTLTTRYNGVNANTATPVLVDNMNNVVDTTVWQQNLRGERFVRFTGDLILPRIDNPTVLMDTTSTASVLTIDGVGLMYLLAIPHTADVNSWGERVRIWLNETDWAICEGVPGVESQFDVSGDKSSGWDATIAGYAVDFIVGRYARSEEAVLYDGVRHAGSQNGVPLLYFRGGADSPDHSVPLYFGGGFSGVVLDINDGTQNDYSSFYTHPYATGPTGCAGIQHAGEISTAFATIDCNAMLAMFPGTPLLSQHLGLQNPPFFNQDGLLSYDLDRGADNSGGLTGVDYGTGDSEVLCTRPSPVILRFPHAHGRYASTGDGAQRTTYIVFGPGQAFPHNFVATDPQGADIVAAGNGYSATPFNIGNSGANPPTYLPNLISNYDNISRSGSDGTAAQSYLPGGKTYQRGAHGGWNFPDNWEPAQGEPNVISQVNTPTTYGYDLQSAPAGIYAQHFDNHFAAVTRTPPPFAHPYTYAPAIISGAALRKSGYMWHMDGGYHPGGSFLDNHIQMNPTSTHPTGAAKVSVGTVGGPKQHPASFRVAGVLVDGYSTDNPDMDYVVVDATRAQNAEELAAVLAAAINTWPGTDPLKAIGGTFLPSMQHAHNQDRYGWVDAGNVVDGIMDYINHGTLGNVISVATIPSHSTLPAYGWVRLTLGGNIGGVGTGYAADATGVFAPYKQIDTTTLPGTTYFVLEDNILNANPKLFQDPISGSDLALGSTTINGAQLYAWSKAGTHRFNNDRTSANEHMTQVHFNGYINAVDRTSPIGAVGWHGERYSYLNSLQVTNEDSTTGFAAGLGAWHPFLGFSPYGASSTCQALTQIPAGDAGVPGSKDCPGGLHPRHLVVVSYEGELALAAKTDRDGTVASGDWLLGKELSDSAKGGHTGWADLIHNADRFVAPANAGPNVEALIGVNNDVPDTPYHSPGTTETPWHDAGQPIQHEPCLYQTGDLFYDDQIVPEHTQHNSGTAYDCTPTISKDNLEKPYDYWKARHAGRNFNIEHIVWKRMDGGNLCMPASNTRGLGGLPKLQRVVSGVKHTIGETLYGNNRFSFETTNSAMLPIIQAQELTHPQLAEQHPVEVRNAMQIPNEEIQFESILVVDDTGQEHILQGGSPFGTVIRDFELVSDRAVEGLSPALAGSGIAPNMRIQLPHSDDIPGNILVRSGFDRIQAWQNETMGSGGLQHPAQPKQGIKDIFNDTASPTAPIGPRAWPTWEDKGWEHISQDGENINVTKGTTRLAFPDSHYHGWSDHTQDNPLETAYEPHDRALFFHITRPGHASTYRNPVAWKSGAVRTNTLAPVASPFNTAKTEFTVNASIDAFIWDEATPDSRYFFRLHNPTTGEGAVASFTGGIGTTTFTGVVLTPDFLALFDSVTDKTTFEIVPSWYVPAGSSRFFASRRLRDHAEISGNSPDMKQTDWSKAATPHTMLTENSMTPMPIPRMGHHFVTPTMAMSPGHYAHPAYQRLYDLHHACSSASIQPSLNTNFTRDPLIWFSTPTAANRPSDVAGGAFTLLTETKVRFDGYGVLAAVGAAGTTNSQGTHEIVLEAAGAYTLRDHFPDPLEVGAYQIVIQPNLYKQQFNGFHRNHSDATKAPYESGTLVTELTGQQVHTVIAIEHTVTAAGAVTLILAEATMADTRGCEVMMNEVMLDLPPDPGDQFTQLPTLALFNPIGVNETAAPALTRRSLPYRPGTFERSTPGYTLTVPWWAQLHKNGPMDATAAGFLGLEHHKPDDYYRLCRATYGCVSTQITLAGYPSSFVDIYEAHRRVRSLNPHCVIMSNTGAGGMTITVDDCELFPVNPYYGEVIEYVDASGVRQTATYGNRTGTAMHTPLAGAHTFQSVTGNAAFWAGIQNDTTILRLSGPYDYLAAGDIFKTSKKSMVTRILPQVLHGSRDTNSLHMADAFLCLWHPNLGRPYTYYGDNATRTFYDDIGTADNAVDEKGLNNVPEHYETIRYQEFFYSISKGPFVFDMKWLKPQSDGAALSPTDPNLLPFEPQGDLENFFSGFWPGGSRGGAAGSRLDGYNIANYGWGGKDFDTDCNSYDFLDTTTGIRSRTYAQVNTASEFDRNRCFGWRFAVRPAYNRPRWSPSVRGWLEVDVVGGADTGVQSGYYHGPFVQQDDSTWVSKADAGLGAVGISFDALVTGIIERQTSIAAMLGNDQLGRQVRYADGRRMTRAYGCPLRVLRNPSTARRMFPGDSVGKSIDELADAHRYYLVDWWGNTRGEDMRRFPVRGFGARPAWDPEAYEDGGAADEPTARNLFHTIAGEYPPVMRGNTNSTNSSINPVDWFNPKNAARIGDRGDGRGSRWPTAFNEWKLQAVSTDTASTGLVASFNTAEPPFTVGLLRPSNNALDAREVPRGISARLGVDEAGLLKPEAVVGQNIESTTTYTRTSGETLIDPVSRVAPRIGLDADTTREIAGGQHIDYVALSTQAHSLHADRAVGQRTYVAGAFDVSSQTLGDFDLTTLSWASNPNKAVVRMSDAHAFLPLGGTYILEARNFVNLFDDSGWGKAGASSSSNPYQDSAHDPVTTPKRTNHTDSTVRFLLRPSRALDNRHIELMRATPKLQASSPQKDGSGNFNNAYRALVGGKYGLFNYDAPGGRVGTTSPTSPPYAPVYDVDTTTPTAADSVGPKIPGAEATGFSKDVTQTVGRVYITENTLEHLRSDAPRRRTTEENGARATQPDFAIEPRFSQTLHPKGEGATSNFNTGDHTGE